MGRLQQQSGQTQSAMSSFGSVAERALGYGLGVIGVNSINAVIGGIARFTQQTITAAANLQELQNRAQVVFGNDFADAQQKADALALALHRASDNMLESMTGLSLVAEGLGVSDKAALAMSEDLTRLAVDFSKAMGGTQADAMQALTLALEGSGRALRQYGIVLNDDTLQQYANAQGIRVKVGNMDQEQKAILTYHFLMEKTKAIQETAIKNTGSMRDRTAELADAWQDFQQVAGKPFIGPLASAIEAVTGFIKGLDGEVRGVTADFQALFQLVNNAVGGGIGKYFSYVGDNFKKVFGGKTNNVLNLTDSAFAQPDGKAPFKALDEAMKSNAGAAADWAKGWRDNSGAAADAATKKLEEIKNAMEGVGGTYQDVSRSVTEKLSSLEQDHADAMHSLRGSIDDVTRSLKDLQDEYDRTVNKLTEKEANTVADQELKVKKLQDKFDTLRDSTKLGGFTNDMMVTVLANRRGEDQGQDVTNAERKQFNLTDDQISLLNARIELDKERKALQTYQAVSTLSPEALGAARTREGGSEFSKAIEDIKRQREEDQQSFDQRKANLDSEMQKLNDKKAAEEAAYSAQRQQLQLTRTAVDEFANSYAGQMANISKVTQDTVDGMKKKLDELKNTISAIDALLSSKADITGGGTVAGRARRAADRLTDLPAFGDGGVVTRPTVALIGEKGPEKVVPLDREEKPVAQNVNIGPFYITKEVDMNEVLRQITRAIQLQPLASA